MTSSAESRAPAAPAAKRNGGNRASAAASNHPIWVAMGAAVVGTFLGGLAVWMGLQGREAPAATAPTPAPVVTPAPDPTPAPIALPPEQPLATALAPEERLMESVERTRATVVSLKVGEAFRGAGVIYDEHGLVLTNYHVVEPVMEQLALRGRASPVVTARFDNGRELPAEVVLGSRDEDVAVLRLRPADSAERFEAAEEGRSSELRVGQRVYAVGVPVGLEHTLATGFVSALNRTDVLQNRQLPVIQLDASINLGNSGGPLFNLDGALVGITTARSSQGEGIGFAIPIDRVRMYLTSLKEGEASRSGVIGVFVDAERNIDEALRAAGYLNGVWLRDVVEGPAKRAGLRAGDIIVEIRGKRFDDFGTGKQGRVRFFEEFGETVRGLIAGETLDIRVIRPGEESTLEFRIEVEAATESRQARIDAEELLGLRLVEDRKMPVVEGVVSGSRLAGAPLGRQLTGLQITHVVGQRVKDVETLGRVLAAIRGWGGHTRRRGISVTFRDPEGGSYLVQGFPLRETR